MNFPSLRWSGVAAVALLGCVHAILLASSSALYCGEGGKSAAVKVSPLELRRVEQLGDATPATVPGHVSVGISGDSVYIPLHIEFEDSAARRRFRAPQGVTVYHEFDRFADAFVDVRSRSALAELQAVKGVSWIDADMQTVRVPPPPKAAESRERPRTIAEKIVRGGHGELKGKGVVVAVIDDGIDFRHKDFIVWNKEGEPTSRLLYYWDTFASRKTTGGPGQAAPVSYPDGSSIGTVYTQEELTAELRQPTGRITAAGSHGTRCAGIAVGNGNGMHDQRYIGVAPEAEIIGVRIGGLGPWNQFLLGAICAWIDEKAGAKPCVVSCSFGHAQQGGRDGCRVVERQLDARFDLGRKGRAICIAAGNEAENLGFGPANYHAEALFQGKEDKGVISWASPTNYRVAAYVNTADPDDVAFNVTGTPPPAVHRYRHRLSNALVIEIGDAPAGNQPSDMLPRKPHRGQIEIWSKSRTKLRVDAFIDTEPWNSGAFQGGTISKTGLLRTPGTMSNALTIGSYDFNALDDRSSTTTPKILLGSDNKPMRLGDLSSYTSPGYSRSGQVKPTVVAPGQWYLAAAAGGPTDGYDLMNGTSAATPYTAGVVALLFEKKADLTLGQLHSLFRRHATTNAITGRTPNPQWGYGRFDYDAAQAVFSSVK